jgi:predicted transcriptional regulator
LFRPVDGQPGSYWPEGNSRRDQSHDHKDLIGSQEEFADICGMDRTYIGGIERGERNVSLVNIERIAKALKMSIPRLFRNV